LAIAPRWRCAGGLADLLVHSFKSTGQRRVVAATKNGPDIGARLPIRGHGISGFVVGGCQAAIGGKGVVELLPEIGEAPTWPHFEQNLGDTAWIVPPRFVDPVDDGGGLAATKSRECRERVASGLFGGLQADIVASLAHRLLEIGQSRPDWSRQWFPRCAVALLGRP